MDSPSAPALADPPPRRPPRLSVPLPAIGGFLLLALVAALAFRHWRAKDAPGGDNPPVDRQATLEALRADLPERDLVALAARFGRIPHQEIETARTLDAPRPPDTVGDVERFFVHDIVSQRFLEVDAELQLLTDVAAVWVQRGQPFDADALAASADRFSEHVYPELRAAFGAEWSPGVDHDPRVHILHHEPVLGIAGFFSSADEMSPAVDSRSNAREMFYINLSVFRPGTDSYLALLAHEFQHMIHWNADRGEPTWVNEGLSEIAPYLVGYGAQRGEAYLSQPDIQLTSWEPTAQSNSAHYAASYLFLAYLQDRYGDEVLRAIVAAPENGANGIEAAIASLAAGGGGMAGGSGDDSDDRRSTGMGEDAAPSFDDLFLDWTVANMIGDAQRETDEGGAERWSYERSLPRVVRPAPLNLRGVRDSVSQHGADYWDVIEHVRDGRLELAFAGAPTVGLLDPLGSARPGAPTRAEGGYPGDGAGSDNGLGISGDDGDSDDGYPGDDGPSDVGYPGDGGGLDSGDDGDGDIESASNRAIWWSGSADGMHSRLEREIDLTEASEAWLELRVWYELEENWDYAYYTASTDGGRTWRPLGSRLTNAEDPNGNNLGEGLTGDSDGWVQDRLDLTPLAGAVVHLAIEVITDDAVSLAGVAVDEARVVVDGAEPAVDPGDSRGGWTPVGWIHVDPRLPQVWGLQVIVDNGERLRVERFNASSGADADGRAVIDVADIPPDASLTLVVSGLTPGTRNPARYEISPRADPLP